MKRVAIILVGVLSLIGCAQRDRQIAAAAQPAPVMPQHNSILPAEIQRVSPESGKPFVYVSREVQLPGCYAWTEGMTLTDVIEAAGGLTPFAGSRIRISHVDGTTEVYRYGQIKKHASKDPFLRVGDRVWVQGDLL
jgi:protein involved in polysaccharide export with SLBB domain